MPTRPRRRRAGAPARPVPPSAEAADGDPPDTPEARVNLAVVAGTCSSPPEVRVMPSGRALATVQVTTRTEPAGAVSVPVALWDPPAWVDRLDAGDAIVAVGRVRRRFYRSGGATASRVEVEAVAAARPGDRRRVHALARRAHDALAPLLE